LAKSDLFENYLSLF